MADPSRFDKLDTIMLKGRVVEQQEGQYVTLDAQGAFLTVNAKDIKATRDVPGSTEKELVVASNAKIVYEAVIRPIEADGILSKDAMVAIVGGPRHTGECECSRCTGGECECSRCTSVFAECSRCSGGGVECSRCSSVFAECSRCTGGECECSRCTSVFAECSRCSGGECECSRCLNALSGLGRTLGRGFRRQIS